MTATAKFLFDNDFGSGAGGRPTIALAEHEAKLAEAEAAAYRNGYAAAQEQAQAEADRSTAAMLARIAAALEALQRASGMLEARIESEAVEVAVAAARKLACELTAHEPFAEIAALVSDCLRELVNAPHIVVRVNDALLTEAQDKLTTIARERGFEGRLVVLAEPDIAVGDCRIEWADGGITRDRNATEAAIAELIDRYLGARRTDTAAASATPDDPGSSQS